MSTRKLKSPRSIPFEQILDKQLASSSKKEHVAYLNACLGDHADDGLELFFKGLEDIARARGVAELAEEVKLNRDTFYKTFAHKNPKLSTFRDVLNSLGFDISIVPRGR